MQERMKERYAEENSELLWQYIDNLKSSDNGQAAPCHVRSQADLEEMAALVPFADAVNKVLRTESSDSRGEARARLERAIEADGAPAPPLIQPRAAFRARVPFRFTRQVALVVLLLAIGLVALAMRVVSSIYSSANCHTVQPPPLAAAAATQNHCETDASNSLPKQAPTQKKIR